MQYEATNISSLGIVFSEPSNGFLSFESQIWIWLFHCSQATCDVSIAIAWPGSDIDPTANVDQTSIIGPFVTVGANATIERAAIVSAFSVVGANATIGHNTLLAIGVQVGTGNQIGSNVILGGQSKTASNVRIGNRTVLGYNTQVNANTTVGASSNIQFNSVIGSNNTLGQSVVIGFASNVRNNVTLRDVVQLGPYVSIGDNVTVGILSNLGTFSCFEAGAIVPSNTKVPDFAAYRTNGDISPRPYNIFLRWQYIVDTKTCEQRLMWVRHAQFARSRARSRREIIFFLAFQFAASTEMKCVSIDTICIYRSWMLNFLSQIFTELFWNAYN